MCHTIPTGARRVAYSEASCLFMMTLVFLCMFEPRCVKEGFKWIGMVMLCVLASMELMRGLDRSGFGQYLHFTFLNFSCSSSHNPALTAGFSVPPSPDPATATAK